MKLDAARLCLDCEEVHEQQHCPACGSEVFAFLTRWIEPAADMRSEGRRPRPSVPEVQPSAAEHLEAYRQLLNGERPRRTGLITKSVLGLAAFSLAGWAWRSASRERAATIERQRRSAESEK
jgi:hypothetical protein